MDMDVDVDVERVVLNYIDDITCDICLCNVKEDVVGVTCCHSIFHGKCLEANRVYSNICPKCEEMYRINKDNPLFTRLTLGPSKIGKIYAAIYRVNPDHLIIIDQALRAQGSKISYHEKFQGYYPYHMFNDNFNIDQFTYNYEVFCYGLLKGYNWEHTSACGSAVWKLAKKGNTADINRDHIYLVIYNRDYRKVRQQLNHLLTVIETNCTYIGLTDVTMYIHDGILVVNIRGIVRKICVYLEYNDDPFWIIYNPKTHFNAYGSLYTFTPAPVLTMSVKAIVNNNAPNFTTLSSLDHVMGYKESKSNYAKRIGCGIGTRTLLLNDVYPDYILRISERHGIDSVKKMMIGQIVKDLSHILNVEQCINPDAVSDIVIELVSKSGTIDIPTTIVTPKHIRKQVSKIVYQQPLHLYPTLS